MNKSLKILLTFIFMTMLPSLTMAQNKETVLDVRQKSGTVVCYSFSEKPVVTFTKTDLVLTTTTVIVEYPLSGLEKFTFSKSEPTNVQSIEVETPETDGPTSVYDDTGRLVKTVQAGEPLRLDDMKTGLYIIKNNNSYYKTLKR